MLKHIPILGDFFVSKKDYEKALADVEEAQIRNNNNYENFRKQTQELVLYKQINEILKQKSKIVTVAGFDDNEAEPTETVARKEYVKEVDIFYDNILKKKLKTSIADIRELLSNIHVANGFPQNMQRDQYDYFLRGMEAFAWKIDEWATTLQGERREVLQDKENQE